MIRTRWLRRPLARALCLTLALELVVLPAVSGYAQTTSAGSINLSPVGSVLMIPSSGSYQCGSTALQSTTSVQNGNLVCTTQPLAGAIQISGCSGYAGQIFQTCTGYDGTTQMATQLDPSGLEAAQAFQDVAIDTLLSIHLLPPTDAQRAILFGRNEVRAAMYVTLLSLLERDQCLAAKDCSSDVAALGPLTTQQQQVVDWFKGLLWKHEIDAARQALDEWHTFQVDPCHYVLPPGFPDNDQNWRVDACADQISSIATLYNVMPPGPSADAFESYGLAKTYGDLVAAAAGGTTVLAESIAGLIGLSAAVAAGIAVFSGVVLTSFLAGGAVATFIGTVFSASTSLLTAATALAGGAAIAVLLLAVGIIVTIEAAQPSTETTLQGNLASATSTAPDIGAILDDTSATAGVGQFKLLSTLLAMTLPDPPIDDAVPVHGDGDPQFRVFDEMGQGGNPTPTISIQTWTPGMTDAEMVDVSLVGGWFATARQQSDQSVQRELTLHVNFIGWDGKQYTAERVGQSFLVTEQGMPIAQGTQKQTSLALVAADGSKNTVLVYQQAVVTIGALTDETGAVVGQGGWVLPYVDITLNASFTDPGFSGSAALTVAWGDGTMNTQNAPPDQSTPFTHTYTVSGTDTVYVTAVNGSSVSLALNADVPVMSPVEGVLTAMNGLNWVESALAAGDVDRPVLDAAVATLRDQTAGALWAGAPGPALDQIHQVLASVDELTAPIGEYDRLLALTAKSVALDTIARASAIATSATDQANVTAAQQLAAQAQSLLTALDWVDSAGVYAQTVDALADLPTRLGAALQVTVSDDTGAAVGKGGWIIAGLSASVNVFFTDPTTTEIDVSGTNGFGEDVPKSEPGFGSPLSVGQVVDIPGLYTVTVRAVSPTAQPVVTTQFQVLGVDGALAAGAAGFSGLLSSNPLIYVFNPTLATAIYTANLYTNLAIGAVAAGDPLGAMELLETALANGVASDADANQYERLVAFAADEVTNEQWQKAMDILGPLAEVELAQTANVLGDGQDHLSNGEWSAAVADFHTVLEDIQSIVNPPTPTATVNPPTETPTATMPVAPSSTPTGSAPPSPSPSPAQSATPTSPAPPPSSPSPPVSATPTLSPPSCVGDCNRDGKVVVSELTLGVDIALGSASLAECSSLACGQETEVTVNCLVAAVENALDGCPSAAE